MLRLDAIRDKPPDEREAEAVPTARRPLIKTRLSTPIKIAEWSIKRKRTAPPKRCLAKRVRSEQRPVLRLTVSAAYRYGAEVLLFDSGPLPDLAAVRDALSEIDGALNTHADLIFERGAELLVRAAERHFERPYPKRAQKRVAHRDEF